MTTKQFQLEIQRTWNFQNPQIDTVHSLLGCLSETGELISAYKKHIGYNKPVDYVNVKEELGDLLYFIYTLFRCTDWNTEEVEIDTFLYNKLCKRYENNDMSTELHVVKALHFEMASLEAMYSMERILLNEKVTNIMTYITFMCNVVLKVTTEEVMETVINKLKARFPEKFNQDNAINRDLKEERKALES